ncbi:hypothetical protein [Haloferula sp. BvORR071]|uniref:hypothetical protein n=1 Tax=Haloferula sp. BvORR071 TaxID=1396141 RepID=UPI0005562069|nr:hypothetical protein [Haloferula sp. BvORR071]
MKSIFYALSLLVIGAAAFFSFQNVDKFKAQKSQREAAETETASLNGKIKTKSDELDAEQTKLTEANADKSTTTQNISQAQSAGKKLARDIAELNGKIEAQKTKMGELEKVREKINEILKGGGLNSIDEVPAKIAELKAEQAAKQKQLDELKNAIAVLEKNVASNQDEIGRLGERDSSRDSRIGKNAMQATVSAVNEDWGFVIISAGSTKGFTPQTKLLVKRNGRLIAKINPSSIEPSQTIAEIDKDTLAPGARIQPGDEVILAEPATN